MTSDAEFTELTRVLEDHGPAAALQFLVERLRQGKRYDDLFDVRLMQCRLARGLPWLDRPDLDDLPAPLQGQLEADYVAVCREVGQLLLDEGEYRRAWVYLRAAGAEEMIREALRRAEPGAEDLDQLVELCVYEGIDPGLGFPWLLEHQGTCNAITAYESVRHTLDRQQQEEVTGILVGWLHAELLGNLRADLEEAAEGAEGGSPLRAWLAGGGPRLDEFTTHIDVSHLAAVLRFARQVTDREALQRAWELAEYGRRLHDGLQPAADPPFSDYFPAHALFFAAQLGHHPQEAVDYFGAQATAADLQVDSVVVIEVYIVLLARLGRLDEALKARAELIPPDVSTTGFAPGLLELSRLAGRFELVIEMCRQRGDLLGYALGRLHADAARGAGRALSKKPRNGQASSGSSID
ncbi:MAG: hypothetical protein GTO03_09695 [Planctomycetales bacterium]|nr:hypothetical protein [Planctomycetales bacterium]